MANRNKYDLQRPLHRTETPGSLYGNRLTCLAISNGGPIWYEEGMANPTQDDEPLCDEAGVDLTLIRWYLTLTLSQRIDALESMAALIQEARARAAEA